MNINHSSVSGNLTRPVELRTVSADKAVASFTIANNSKYKTASGEQREETCFLDCEAWGKTAETAAQYLSQGQLVIVEGRLKQDNFTDKDGNKRSKIKMVVEKLHLVPRGEKREASDAPSDTHRPSRPTAPASAVDDSSLPPF